MLAANGYHEGDVVPFSFSAGIIIASYLVSLTGAGLTVELLHVRTALKGWVKWLELLACSTAMGLVGIWSMHFVGNRSIIMGNGDPSLQLVYNRGWTIFSAFIPIIVLFFAFAVADRRYKGGWQFVFYLITPGIAAGCAICGMHYAGSEGIANYDVHFAQHPAYVVGAILIACSACVCALAGLFILQDLWMTNFLWRYICAIGLAAAVSAMHWVASNGTIYVLKANTRKGDRGRNRTFFAALGVCLATIPVFVFMRWWQVKRKRQLAERAQQVVLACARFDGEGRIMVSQDGHLPCQKITVDRNQMTFEDDFDTTHAAFKWIFRASHNWSSVAKFVPRMRSHLQAARFLPSLPFRSNSTVSSFSAENADQQSTEDYSILFREGFCVAASDLALEIKTDMSEMGTLYEQVMMTGTIYESMLHERREHLNRLGMVMRRLGFSLRPPSPDVEANSGMDLYGKGQLLVLTSQCGKREVSRHLADGYRFETLDKITERLARNMQVPTRYLGFHLQKLRLQTQGDQLPAPRGTLLGCFALRPGISKRSWDVAVRKDCLDRLPFVQLSPKAMDTEALAVIQQLDGMSVADCCEFLDEKPDPDDPLDFAFAKSLRQRITQLSEMVAQPFFQQAIFSSRLFKVPTFDVTANVAASCSLLVFHVIPDVHTSSLKSSASITYTPLSFFQCRQQCLRGAPHHASFYRKVHHEFACMSPHHVTQPERTRLSVRSSSSDGIMMLKPSSTTWMSKSPVSSIINITSSKSRKMESRDSEQGICAMSPPSASYMPFGGILVSQDISVEATPRTVRDDSKGFMGFGTLSYAGTADPEIQTYVDELFALTTEKWRGLDRSSRRTWTDAAL